MALKFTTFYFCSIDHELEEEGGNLCRIAREIGRGARDGVWERRAAAKETGGDVRELFVTSCRAVIGSVPKWLFAREGQLMKSGFWKKGTYYIRLPQFGVLEIDCLFRVVKSGPELGLIFGKGFCNWNKFWFPLKN